MAEQTQAQKKENRSKWLILLLLLITVIAIGVTIWALFFRKPQVILAPDYAPKDVEVNAKPIEGDNHNKLEQPVGGGAVSLSYSNVVTIDLSDEAAALSFANPGKSNQDMIVQIVVQDVVLAQSGRLIPGYEMEKLNLLGDAADALQVGGYDGFFVIYYYTQDTGEKAVLNTRIPITITVCQ